MLFENNLDMLRHYFTVVHQHNSLSVTLINQNIDREVIETFAKEYRLSQSILKLDITILQCPNFDDELLMVLSAGLPQSVVQLTLDFNGCESLKGSGFLQLFQAISAMNLTKLSLDFGEIFQLNDIAMEGLSILIGSLQNLQDLYLDMYEVDHIKQDGYIILADSLTSLQKLKKIHLDFSANIHLSQDALELFFGNLPNKLTHLHFRILDIEQIGGGSFFRLAKSIQQMKNLQQLQLTIASFANISHQGIQKIISAISKAELLQNLLLNFSDINLPSKIFGPLKIPKSLRKIKLDLSCNRQLTDSDILNLACKIQNVQIISLNLDFCDKITEDAIEQLIFTIFENKNCFTLEFPDRQYSKTFVESLIHQCIDRKHFMKLNLQTPKQLGKRWKKYKIYEQWRRNIVFATKLMRQKMYKQNVIKDVLSMII